MNTALKHSLLTLAALLGTTAGHAQLFENFTYANGDITTGSGSAWVRYGTDNTTPLNISSGMAIINQGTTTAGRADVGRAIGGTFTAAANTTAFVGFDATWSVLPSNNNGSYFAAFSTSPTATTFFGRIGADLSGAATGKFRIAVANASWSTANSTEFPLDLSLNTAYRVVVEYNLVSQQTTLWVNPTSAADTHVTATDLPLTAGVPQADITAFSLRQGVSSSTGVPGVIALDNLSVGASFAAVPEPAEYAALFGGGLLAFALLRRRVN